MIAQEHERLANFADERLLWALDRIVYVHPQRSQHGFRASKGFLYAASRSTNEYKIVDVADAGDTPHGVIHLPVEVLKHNVSGKRRKRAPLCNSIRPGWKQFSFIRAKSFGINQFYGECRPKKIKKILLRSVDTQKLNYLITRYLGEEARDVGPCDEAVACQMALVEKLDSRIDATPLDPTNGRWGAKDLLHIWQIDGVLQYVENCPLDYPVG